MESIAVDAGPLVAICDPRDRHHGSTTQWLAGNQMPLVTTWLTLGEAFHLLSDDGATARRMITWAAAALIIDEATSSDIERIVGIMEKYSDLPADLADAALLAMCERRKIGLIATLDSDFEVYRTKSRRALQNVLRE